MPFHLSTTKMTTAEDMLPKYGNFQRKDKSLHIIRWFWDYVTNIWNSHCGYIFKESNFTNKQDLKNVISLEVLTMRHN